MSIIFHLDMDCFFASVEQAKNPLLKDKPVIVSGNSSRSVVLSASYEARAKGIKTAMAYVTAKAILPDAYFVKVDRRAYVLKSGEVKGILKKFFNTVEMSSLDEAYVDATNRVKNTEEALALARAVKAAILKETLIPCSIGIASSKVVAKIASKVAKPRIINGSVSYSDGIVLVEENEKLSFLKDIPVALLPLAGPKTRKKLEPYGVSVIGDIWKLGEQSLKKILPVGFARALYRNSLGEDDATINEFSERKSLSYETTFEKDYIDFRVLKTYLERLVFKIFRRLEHYPVKPKTVFLKVKYSDFVVITRQKSYYGGLPSEITVISDLSVILKTLLNKSVRLLGVGVSNFEQDHEYVQQSLFDARQRDYKLEAALEKVRKKYGRQVIKKGLKA